jgi:putative phage-type endonuclease
VAPVNAVELLPPNQAVHGNTEWYELRREGVTASEIPVILGLSGWDSPWALWHRKRGLIGDDPDTEDASWGRRLEPVIADAAADRLDPHENLVFTPAGLYRHAEREWQMATPDRLVISDECMCAADYQLRPGDILCTCLPHEGELLALLEVKHPYSWDGWGDDGSDDIPADYMAQVLWQCDVMGVDECWLAAYSRHEMRCYTIRADTADARGDLELMRKVALEFLHSQEPPPLDSHLATLRAVKTLHPDIEDREQDVPAKVARDYRLACYGVDIAKARKREAESALRLAMSDARRAFTLDPVGLPEPVATRSIYQTRRIDGKRLRADHPDLATQYTTTSTVDKLTPRKDSDNGEDQ